MTEEQRISLSLRNCSVATERRRNRREQAEYDAQTFTCGCFESSTNSESQPCSVCQKPVCAECQALLKCEGDFCGVYLCHDHTQWREQVLTFCETCAPKHDAEMAQHDKEHPGWREMTPEHERACMDRLLAATREAA